MQVHLHREVVVRVDPPLVRDVPGEGAVCVRHRDELKALVDLGHPAVVGIFLIHLPEFAFPVVIETVAQNRQIRLGQQVGGVLRDGDR